MDITTLKPGDKVYFGRTHGEKTLGRVKKVNAKSVKVEQLESRGSFKDHRVGTTWRVAPIFVFPAPQDAVAQVVTKPENLITVPARDDRPSWGVSSHVTYPGEDALETPEQRAMRQEIERLRLENEFLKANGLGAHKGPKRPDALILEDIKGVYGELSPENLTCDGELSGRALTRKASALRTKLAGLFRELGRRVSESEAFGF